MTLRVSDARVSSLQAASDLDDLLVEAFGTEVHEISGVLQTAAVWRAPDGRLIVLEIVEQTPRSTFDSLLLNVGRARADSVVTTGRILRLEPGLSFAPFGPERVPESLARWRRRRTSAPLEIVVLSSGRDLPWQHTVFCEPVRFRLATDNAGVERARREAPPALRERLGFLQLERGGGIRAAVRALRAHGDDVTVEAGPSTSLQLYGDRDETTLIDWLLLSSYEGRDLPPPVRGSAFLERSRIEACFEARGVARSSDGLWGFELLRRR